MPEIPTKTVRRRKADLASDTVVGTEEEKAAAASDTAAPEERALTEAEKAQVAELLQHLQAQADAASDTAAPTAVAPTAASPAQSSFDYGKTLVKTGLFAVTSGVIKAVWAIPSLSLETIAQAAMEGGVGGLAIGGAILGLLALCKKDPGIAPGVVIQMLIWSSSAGNYLMGETPDLDLAALNATMAEHGWTCEPPAF